jgi:hypothetical protein
VSRRVLALLPLLLLACSSGLEGERAEEPVRDWSFVANASDVTFWTADGTSFRGTIARPVLHEGALYLHAYTIFPLSEAILEVMNAGDEIFVRVDGVLHAVRATPLRSAAEIDPILPALVGSEMRMEATGLRWDPTPARYPGTQVMQWFFRLESIAGG